MHTKIYTVIAFSSLFLALAGCTPEQRMSHKAPGSYESTETATDDKGTTTVKTSTTEVSMDENGHRRETITSKTSRDPKGLMNKTTTKKTSKTVQQ